MTPSEHIKLAQAWKRVRLCMVRGYNNDAPLGLLSSIRAAAHLKQVDTLTTEAETHVGMQGLLTWELMQHSVLTCFGLACRRRVCQELEDRHRRLARRGELAAVRRKKQRRAVR
jgi:hypothetical protein